MAHDSASDSVKPINMSARSWVIAVKSAVSDCGHSAVGLPMSGFSSAFAPQPANINTANALATTASLFIAHIYLR
ncbi:MAG: hypothetical protein EBQ54_00965 [Actinobacteria bacterium]|nr:hypothetical protein [Actinomycetota bacterium]